MPKTVLRSLVSFIFLVGFSIMGQAQNRDLYWYFGSNASSIEFTQPALNAQRVMLPNTLGTGGGAVAADYLNGALLFYTDGINVYAADHSLLTTLTGSNTRNQAAVVCLNPQDTDFSEYFLFTIDNSGTIRSTVYDKSEYRNATFPSPPDGNLSPGRVNQIDPNLPGGTLSEGMIVIANDTRDGFWLITHQNGTTNYNVTQIGTTGITNTSVAIPGAPTDVTNFSFNETRNQLAVSPANGTDDIVLLDIDPAIGSLSLSATDLSVVNPVSVYDTEWSSSGDYLYISGDFGGANQELLRLDLTQTPVVSESVLTTDVINSFGLQYGADTAIYHLFENSSGQFRLGRIEAPNTPDINQIMYNANPIPPPNSNYQGRQFPSFLPPFNLLTLDFTYVGTCANVPTYFFPQVTPDIAAIEWDFLGDGNYMPLVGGAFTYPAAGTYNVTMRVSLGGAVDSVTQAVTINDFDLTIQINPQQQYWCTDDFGDRIDPATSIVTYTATASGANASGAVIRWSNQTAAEANATTTFVEPGTYYVVATDPVTGCEAYMEQQVFEYGVQNNFAFVWYFGDHGGLDFNPLFDLQNPGPITPIDFGGPDFNGGNQMESVEGCAIYCDPNGDPLLFSDGEEVYNKAGTQITNSLGGQEGAAQSIFIVQNPSDATQYYLFFTKEVPESNDYQFSYAVFDLKLLNGDGDLIKENGTPIITTLFTNSTERITGNANWVIVHEYGNDIFRAYPLTGQGVGAPVFSNVGQSHTITATSGKSYMKLSGDKLAVALSISNNENYIDLFDFDVATGAITEVITLDFDPDTGQAYGVEFSPDGSNVYATLRNSGGGTRIIGWNIDTTTVVGQTTDPSYIEGSKTQIAFEAGTDMGALQQGPQGSIYIAKDGASTLASIDNPDDIMNPQYNLVTGDFPNVGSNLIDGISNMSRLGLPNFVDFNGSATPTASLSVLNGCQNDPLVFTVLNPLPDPQIESYIIQLYDSTNTIIGTSPTLDANTTTWTFTATQNPGNYEAEFFILNTCGLPTSSNPRQPFAINALPTIGTITPTAPTFCGMNDGSAMIEFTSTGSLIYSITGPVAVPQASVTGPSTEVVSNLAAGFYTLNVTQLYLAGSCSQSFTFSVPSPVGYTLTAAEDDNADCNGENGIASFVLGGGAPPAVFTWELRRQADNVVVDNGNETRTVSNAIDAGDYYFQVLDPGGCISTANVTITIPTDIDLVLGNIPIACDGEPIVFDITTSDPQLVTVHEFVNGSIGNVIPNYQVIGINDSIMIMPPATGNGSYEYMVVAQGSIDGPCPNEQLINVFFGTSDPSPFERAFSFCSFEQDESKKFVFFPNSPNGFTSVRWFDASNTEITTSSDINEYEFRNDSLIVKTGGRITVELTNVFGCITTQEINIVEDCKARVSAPNAFRPTSAIGLNQAWRVFPFLVSNDEFEIFIYNRWGQLIFHSDDLNFMINEGWNGGFDNDLGRPLQGGTYAYKVQFKSAFEETPTIQERRGGITLLR